MKRELSFGLALCFGAALGCGDDTGSDNNPTYDAGAEAGASDTSSNTATGSTSGGTRSGSSSTSGGNATTTSASEDGGLTDGGSGDGGTVGADAGNDGGASDGGGFTIWSPDFEDGAPLPERFTCEGKPFGEGYSPDLVWSGAPAGTKSYALVFKDLSIIGGEFPQRAYHWVAWDIPTTVTGIPEQLGVGESPFELQGGKQFRGGPPSDPEFFGPCPSWLAFACPGEPRVTDEYAFALYAFDEEDLDYPEPVEGEPYALALNAFIEEHAFAVTVLETTSNAQPTTSPAPCPIVYSDAGADGGDAGADSGGAAIDGGDDAGDDADAEAPITSDASADASDGG